MKSNKKRKEESVEGLKMDSNPPDEMGSMDLTYSGHRTAQQDLRRQPELEGEERDREQPNESYQVDLTHYNESQETDRYQQRSGEWEGLQRGKDTQRDEDQMIISKDSIDRFLKYNDTNSQSIHKTDDNTTEASAVPKMSNLIIAMAL